MERNPRRPIFGLSTTPVTDIRSELREQIARDMLRLELNRKGTAVPEVLGMAVTLAVVLTVWVKMAGILALLFRTLLGGF